jgi:hypothetical protein
MANEILSEELLNPLFGAFSIGFRSVDYFLSQDGMCCKYLDDQKKEVNANAIRKQMSAVSNQEAKLTDVGEIVKELFDTEHQKNRQK